MKYFNFIIILMLCISCNKNAGYKVNTFKVNDGWGYTIAINDKTIIKQTVIPTISNNESFKNEKDALKVGNLVLQRIKQNLSPTVAKKDLILLEISI